MTGEQLQHADVMTAASEDALALLKALPEPGEHGGQLPAAEHPAVIQTAGLARQGRQIVHRVQDRLMPSVRANVRGDDLALMHHSYLIHVGFDRHRVKRSAARNAVAVGLQQHRLILVDHAGAQDARAELVSGTLTWETPRA